MPDRFILHSEYQPAGDQPEAIAALVRELSERRSHYATLQGVTGSGKTFTMANVIERLQRPTLVISHNKTLAAQLYSELKNFFPENAVEYFVSYYDYYQPEAYIPATDTYIAKDSAINDELERLRLAATGALLERPDVIVVASVSGIYGMGDPQEFASMEQHIVIDQGNRWEVDIYHGPLEGLMTAELEVPTEDYAYSLPDFVGQDVTGDSSYSNASLSRLERWA